MLEASLPVDCICARRISSDLVQKCVSAHDGICASAEAFRYWEVETTFHVHKESAGNTGGSQRDRNDQPDAGEG